MKLYESITGFIKNQVIRRRSLSRWDSIYLAGNAPWDSGSYCPELKKTLTELNLKKQAAVLELGCGTGTNCIFMAQKGFKVTGIDYSQVALDLAAQKTASKKLSIEYFQAALPYAGLKQKYDFIFDRGCFHTMPKDKRKAYSKMVFNLLKKNGKYLLMTGNARKPENPGPPVLTEDEVNWVFGSRLKKIRIRDSYFTTQDNPKGGALALSCLYERIK